MKRFFFFPLWAVAAMVVAFSLSSCSHDDDDTHPTIEKKAHTQFQQIAAQFTDHTVIPTYKALALGSEQLYNDLQQLKAQPSQDQLHKVCEQFLEARSLWERSESFLFGAATVYGIDPHIDSWPLDVQGLKDEMTNKEHLKKMSEEDADVYVGNKLGAELLGFHGIEYILFREGHERPVADITPDELTYAAAVAGDLRNNCYRLWISWAGADQVTPAVREKIESLEVPYTVNNNGETSFKMNLLSAGKAGSTFASWEQAMQQLVDGMMDIVDEVGSTKIGMPLRGEDTDYIESPYSQKSITDYHNNLLSVEAVYMGGISGERNETLSLHNYVKTNNPELDKAVMAHLQNALQKIAAMKAPFVQNYKDPSAQAAADACAELLKQLEKLKEYMGQPA